MPYLNGTVRGNPGPRLESSPTRISPQDIIAALTERAAQAHHSDLEVNGLLSAVLPADPAHDRVRVPLGELCSMKTGPSFSRLGLKERTEQGTGNRARCHAPAPARPAHRRDWNRQGKREHRKRVR